MTLELINPMSLSKPVSYTQVITARGSRLVFVAGQVANVGNALAAAGARTDQVSRITIYVVHHLPDYLPAISEARTAVFREHKPADVLVGVETLAQPGYLIEVDAIAVLD